MAEDRKVAKLDLSGFKPKTAPVVNAVQDRLAVEEGIRHGFTGRADTQKIDGRTLRRKGKTQMNMRVRPDVQDDFKRIVLDFPDADACLAYLIGLYRQT
ncbi:MAG: hypothetical protein KGL20_06140 [Rhodospirillales bacterium]|nr:hypothetical protein [Rhodospirillales bacterium]